MKKLLVIAVGLLSASSLFAGNNVVVSGTVAQVATLNVTTATFTTPDPVAGFTDQQVTTVTERCNSKLGYKVTLASLNAAATAQAYLKSVDAANTDKINYSIKYNGSAVTLVAGSATVTDVTAKTAGTGVTKNLQISIAAAGADYNADTYSDTITFTLTAK